MAKCSRLEPVASVLPDELVFDILTRLPGKQLGRCKCVCKSWRSLIGSPHFSETYRRRHRILLLYWSERLEREGRRLRFYQSHIRQLHEPHPPPEEFSHVHEILVDGSCDAVTQPVNGLIAVAVGTRKNDFSSGVRLTIHNIFTGEAMTIPDPQHRFGSPAAFHLGYDPASKLYKLLKLRRGWGYSRPLLANVMTLRPSASKSRWRVVKYGAASITSLCVQDILANCLGQQEELRTFAGDGVLCWITREEGSLVLFDLHKEKFRCVRLPGAVKVDGKRVIPRARFKEDHLALSLWVFPQGGDHYRSICVCFVMEDDEGRIWSEYCVALPGELQVAKSFAISIEGGGEFLLVSASSESRAVYGYCGNSSGMERLRVGKIPHNKPLDLNTLHCGYNAYSSFNARLSCLLDSNLLHLPLDYVLGGLV